MKRWILAAVAAATLIALPVQAQTDGGKTVVDATIKVAPGEDTGFCFPTDGPGTIQVALSTTDGKDSDPLGPPTFLLAPYRTSPPGPNAPQEIWNLPVTAARTSVELPVVQDLYCFGLRLQTTHEVSVLPSREMRARFRYVALRLTFVAG